MPITQARGALTVLAVTLAACRYQPSPVQLEGSASDIASMAGQWEGTYEGRESGRSGSISFQVQAGKDTAFGDVLMQPRTGGRLVAADMESRSHAMHVTNPSLLHVTFVRIAGGQVEGALEPYIAPDCQCTVSTVFRGVQKNGALEGEFTTSGPMGLRQSGRWTVQRVKP